MSPYDAMKRSPYFFTVILALAMVAATFPGGRQTQLTVTKASQLWVDGTSTVHDWTCKVGEVQGSITLDAQLGEVSKAVVTVPSAAVDCDNRTMNKKAADALKTGDYPTIRYTLKNAEVKKDGETLNIHAVGVLELAGRKNDLAATIIGRPVADGAYKFVGTLPVTMSDFGVDAPSAMFGTIKSGDEVTVRFEIVGALGAGGLSSAQ